MASSIESDITNLLMFGFHITNVNWTEMECVHELNKFTFFKKQWTWLELNSFFQIWMWSEFYSSKKGTYNALPETEFSVRQSFHIIIQSPPFFIVRSCLDLPREIYQIQIRHLSKNPIKNNYHLISNIMDRFAGKLIQNA